MNPFLVTRRRRTTGSVLPTVMILIVITGIYTSSLMSTAAANRIQEANKDVDVRLMASANAAFEYLRRAMRYDTPGAGGGGETGWLSFATDPPDPPDSMLVDGDWIINGATITYQVNTVSGDLGKYDIVVTATAPDGQYAQISRGVEMEGLDMFAFANNGMSSSFYFGTPQSWYGNLWWYSSNGTNVRMAGMQSIYGTLTSWEFNHSSGYQPTNMYQFYDKNGNAVDEDSLSIDGIPVHKEYQYPDENFTKFDTGIDLTQKFSTDAGDLGYPTTADYKFGSGGLPDNAEIFLSPDGNIWWRPFGGSPSDWQVLGQQDGKVVYIPGYATVRGVVTGKVTIAAGQDIHVNGNIVRENDDTAALGLMARDDIRWENRQEVGGAIMGYVDNDNSARAYPGDPAHPDGSSYSINGTTQTYDVDATHRYTFKGSSVDTSTPMFIADTLIDGTSPTSLFKDSDGNTIAYTDWMAQYGSAIESEFTNWNSSDYHGVLPPTAVIEASQYAGDTMGPAVRFHNIDSTSYINAQYKSGSYWYTDNSTARNNAKVMITRPYHINAGPWGATQTSWRSGGTYFLGNPSWPDYVENWDTATYGEHPYAVWVQPPNFLKLSSGEAQVTVGSFKVLHEP